MDRDTDHWVLAFDSSCGSCSGVAKAVAAACGDKITVLPLKHPDVAEWRAQAFIGDPPAAPTLIRVRASVASAWTGFPLALRLTRRIGVKGSFRTIRSLGEMRIQAANGTVVSKETLTTQPRIGRKAFLRQLGLGAAMVGGILISGSLPASADPVHGWLRANRDSLPTHYSDLIALPLRYRRAAYQYMTAAQRSAAWQAHLDEYLTATPHMNDAQRRVIMRAKELASNVRVFSTRYPESPIQKLADDTKNAFGHQAHAIIATLGPSPTHPQTTTNEPLCACALGPQDWCNGGNNHCRQATSCEPTGGCGAFWLWECVGLCFRD